MNKQDFFNKVKIRRFPEKNYNAIWHNLKTLRIGEGVAEELEPDRSEFYDVSLGTKCNAECDFCYTSALKNGVNYEGICETWKKWMDTFPEDIKITDNFIKTEKPLQIACGSQGEPTIAPQFCEFLQTVFETGVVPNYTTNGLTLCNIDNPLTQKILEYTRNFVGGVAVSFGNKKLRVHAENAVRNLLNEGECKVNLHHIISTKESVDEFLNIQEMYGNDIYYHVLLPLMPSGRSEKGVEEGVWEYLESKLLDGKYDNVSFGAHFIKNLETSKIKTWLYPAESLSKNIILEKDKVIITPSSFNLNPIKIINL